jgi:DNA-binding NtrC family response regulator
MKVLIVDDTQELAEGLKTRMTQFEAFKGCELAVDILTEWKLAKEIVRATEYDIVIVDMLMGASKDEGLEVLRHLFTSSAIAIVWTAYPSYENCVQAIRLGAWDYILKERQANDKMDKSIQDAINFRRANPDRGVPNPDDAWAHENLDHLIENYQGKIAAILYGRVIDSDTSHDALMQRIAERKCLVRPTILSIPRMRMEI